MPTRFRDSEFQWTNGPLLRLVRCPQCQKCAGVSALHPPDVRPGGLVVYRSPWRVVCRECGYAHCVTNDPGRLPRDDTRDSLSGLPLWLQVSCAGNVLWAWNLAHLDFLERYVEADLRERTPNVNRSLASRLPRWIKSAKHRDEVLRAIRKLRATLPEWALATATAADAKA